MVATRLFAEHGYANITMSDIARAAGLRQPSLYYWFKGKELILQKTFAVDLSPLEFVERIVVEQGVPALKLYRLIRFDTYQLCFAPCEVNEIARLADSQPELFSDFWEYRQRLHSWITLLIESGVSAGQFFDVDPVLAAWNVLAADAGVQGWFRYQDRQPNHGRSAKTTTRYSAEEIATSVADTALRALLRREPDFQKLRRDVLIFDDFAQLRSA